MTNLKIPILMYHSIELMPKSTVMRSLHVPPKRFKFQMWLLKKLGYTGLSLQELKPYLEGKKIGKVVGITFDDGYQNILLNAAPILKKFNFSSTCYIVSDRIGSSNIWDHHKNITQRPLMSENEISAWLEMGMEIGSHTKTHIDLTSVSEKKAHIEMLDCKNKLEDLFKVSVTNFCYPFGQFDETIVKIAKKCGYQTATTMRRGNVNSDTDAYQMPRIPVNHRTLPHLFLLKVLTNYEDKK